METVSEVRSGAAKDVGVKGSDDLATIELVTEKRVWQLAPLSAQDHREWMHALEKARKEALGIRSTFHEKREAQRPKVTLTADNLDLLLPTFGDFDATFNRALVSGSARDLYQANRMSSAMTGLSLSTRAMAEGWAMALKVHASFSLFLSCSLCVCV